MLQEWFDYTEELRSAGIMKAGDALQPTATATTVRDDGGEALVTDGPFAETQGAARRLLPARRRRPRRGDRVGAQVPRRPHRHDRAAARLGVRQLSANRRSEAAEAVAGTFRAEFGRAVAILARGAGWRRRPRRGGRAGRIRRRAGPLAARRRPVRRRRAWILTTAKRRAIDRLRREAVAARQAGAAGARARGRRSRGAARARTRR